MPVIRESERASPIVVDFQAGPPPGEASDPVPGDKRRTGSGHIDSYGEGRVCRAAGCTTKLSRYNRAAVCWLHEDSGSSHGGPRRK
jgi:hypothetical protein